MATILLVDDYAPNHRLMRFVLEQSGHTVVTASDGQQALDKLDVMPFDLIVTDLAMPHMDGLTLARAIRDDERFRRIPIIVVTASVIEQDQIKATGIGVDTFLTKPVDSEDLTREVDRLVSVGLPARSEPSIRPLPTRHSA
jgi:CheY-like chemotaxis protein